MRQRSSSIVTVHSYANGLLRVIKKPIAMPYNFITSSMNIPSDIAWLESDSIDHVVTIPSLTTDEWFLVNVEQFAFYRVNYNADNWRAIIQALADNPQVFSSRTRAQLIDDSLSLAQDGFLSYNIAFDLIMCLEGEEAFVPWHAAMNNLLRLESLLAETDVHRDFQVKCFKLYFRFLCSDDFCIFQILMLELSERYMLHIAFDDLPNETAIDKLARIRMIDFVCRMKSTDCLNRMHNKLKSHIDEGEKLPVNLESSVFCFGLMASALSGEGPRLFEALLREMQASESTEYRLRIIDSLGCYRDVSVLFDLLETILATSDVRYSLSENFAVIQSVYSKTVEGVEATMNFLIEFPSDAVQSLPTSNLIEILVENLSKGIFNERLLEKVTIFTRFIYVLYNWKLRIKSSSFRFL